MDNWYIIKDIAEFTNNARAIVYNNFGSWSTDMDLEMDSTDDSSQEELDAILSLQESIVIVKQNIRTQKHKTNNSIRYLLNDDIFIDIIEKLNSRMTSNILNGLVQKGLVESAFDSEANDFVFWVKNDTKQQEEEEDNKPETD